MRIIFSLLIILSLAGCAEIDRTMYSVSEGLAPTDRVTGKRTLNLASRQKQVEDSNAAADKIIEELKKSGHLLNEKLNAEQYKRLQRVFKRVHSVSHLKDEEWTVYLLPDDGWNAFTMGGTYVFVNKGLMNDVKNDSELAAVIGHEIAHVTANHIYEQKAHIMAAKLKGSGSVKKKGFQSAFTYKNEEEADEIGTLYAVLAGYDPYGAAHIWKRMYKNSGDFSARTIDHPINSKRYRRNEELAEIYKQYAIPNKINPKAEEILVTNSVFGNGGKTQKELKPGEGGGFMALLEATASALEQHYEAKAESQRQQYNQNFIEYVRSSIKWTDVKLIDNKTLHIPFFYNGIYPIKNLNITAIFDKEQVVDRTENVIQPRSSMIAIFKFKDVTLTAENIQNLRIVVTHVER